MLFVSICAFSQSNTPTLSFGLFLQGFEGIPLEDIYYKCLTNSIDHFEVGANFNQPFVPGNYLWASADSTVSSAYNASVESGVIADLCLNVSTVEMPGWCWAIEYGQIGSSDPKDMSIYENHDILSDYYGLLAERYRIGGTLSQRNGWSSWGVNRYNYSGESDLTWHPSGYNPFLDPSYYKITPSEMRIPELAEVYKQTRQSIHSVDPTAEVALSFMCQPYQESWPYDTYWPTGLGVGEYEEYMTLVCQQFNNQTGYDRYPDVIDWHAYPHYNDPLRFGGDGLWNQGIAEINWWFEDASLSERAFLHDSILDAFGYEDCQLVVLESGATSMWSEIQPQYREDENVVNGHISFMLSTLAEVSANNRTTLLQFDTDIDEVTARENYVPEGYTMRDWWNDSYEEIDNVFFAYSRMVGLLTGKAFLEKQELPVLGQITKTVAVHSYYDPETSLKVYQIRTTLPTSPPEAYRARIPVATRYVNIIPSIGTSYSYDCGPFSPYSVILNVDWTPVWIEELSSQPRLESDQSYSLVLYCENPVIRNCATIRIEANFSAFQGSISVFDLAGRIVDEVPFETDNAGIAVCNWSTENVSSGLYFLREVSGNSEVLGLTVIK